MKIERTEDEKKCIEMAELVDFLEMKEEYDLYAGALLAAKEWGEKVDLQNKKNSNRSVLNRL